ncbi:MAG: hypothetical protein AAGD38_18550 [Acidobacteriota bacterium]
MSKRLCVLGVFVLSTVLAVPAMADGGFCPPLWRDGVLGPLDFNPAFSSIATYDVAGDTRDDLVFSSFFNSIKDPTGVTTIGFFADDLVARIPGIGDLDAASFDPATDVERLTDLGGGPPQTVWPNSVTRVPTGVLPFQAVVVPGGFHTTPFPGRLTVIDVDDPARTEYIVDQTTRIIGAPCAFPRDPNNAPYFYHQARWFDMDGDGLDDLVTVRASFKVAGGVCAPPLGEVVWFENPGVAIDPAVEWTEHLLVAFPSDPFGAEIHLDLHDFEGDGVPEIIGTHFFTGELITIYGAPVGQTWADVDVFTNPARSKDIVTDQGRPFEIEIVDLNNDGHAEVLATNHQGDGCFAVTDDAIPGRVFVAQPPSGDIFASDWTIHVIKDNIRPNPTFPEPTMGPGRLAPGRANAFYPVRWMEGRRKPWIVVGGDEASKVWVLRPRSQHPDNWEYRSAVVFDINDIYGANTTQSLTAPAPSQGNSISTVGGVGLRYDRKGPFGRTELYIPVFEGRDFHKLTFRWQRGGDRVRCVVDEPVACP